MYQCCLHITVSSWTVGSFLSCLALIQINLCTRNICIYIKIFLPWQFLHGVLSEGQLQQILVVDNEKIRWAPWLKQVRSVTVFLTGHCTGHLLRVGTIQFCNVVVIESLLSRDVRKPQHDVTDVTRPSLHSERKISIYSSVCSFSFSHSVILCWLVSLSLSCLDLTFH